MAECYNFEAVQQEIRKAFEHSKGGVCFWIYWILRFLDVSLAATEIWACFGIEVSAVSWQLDGNSFKERNASWIDKLPPWVSKFRMIGTNACSWKQKGCCESSPSCGSTNLCYPVFIHIKPPGVCQLHCVPSRCTVCRTRGSDVKRLRRPGLAAAQI